MKLKCNDGKVRRFRVSDFGDGSIISKLESKCLECGEVFGFHDTKILKPRWKKHICKL